MLKGGGEGRLFSNQGHEVIWRKARLIGLCLVSFGKSRGRRTRKVRDEGKKRNDPTWGRKKEKGGSCFPCLPKKGGLV